MPGTNNTVKRYSRGGFVLDLSVRRLKRPVARRLIVLALKVRHSVPV